MGNGALSEAYRLGRVSEAGGWDVPAGFSGGGDPLVIHSLVGSGAGSRSCWLRMERNTRRGRVTVSGWGASTFWVVMEYTALWRTYRVPDTLPSALLGLI